MANWLLVASAANWNALQKMQRSIWVFNDRKRESARRIRAGDKALVYVSGTGKVLGALTIRGEVQRTVEPVWLGKEAYSYELPISYDVTVDPGRGADMRQLKDALGLIKNKVRWATSFQSGLLRINDADFNAIRSAIRTV